MARQSASPLPSAFHQGLNPAAKAPVTSPPILVPATQSTGIRFSRKTSRTPMCAAPQIRRHHRRTRPTRGARLLQSTVPLRAIPITLRQRALDEDLEGWVIMTLAAETPKDGLRGYKVIVRQTALQHLPAQEQRCRSTDPCFGRGTLIGNCSLLENHTSQMRPSLSSLMP